MLGLQAKSPVGAREKQPHIDVSLPFFLTSPLSKNKVKAFLASEHLIQSWKEPKLLLDGDPLQYLNALGHSYMGGEWPIVTKVV